MPLAPSAHLDDQKVLLREDADGILQAMIDQESGLQGYIGTNNAVFLAAFQQGRPSVYDLCAKS